MSFVLDKTMNPAKVFIERKTKVVERWDPHHYRPEFSRLASQIRAINSRKLQNIVKLSSEQWDQKSHFGEEFPYVEISNIDLFLGRLNAPKVIPTSEAPSRAKMLVRPGDLLVSLTRPTRGAICFVCNDVPLAVASNGLAIIRSIDRSSILPGFLYHILRSSICISQFDQHSSGGNYPAITEDSFLRLLIPLPSITEQENFSDQLDAYYCKAEANLSQASSLLASIDDVLLDELGITCQPEPANTLESRIFKSRFVALTGRRLDPLYHQADIFAFARDVKYGLQRLGDKVDYFISGFPAGRNDQGGEEDGGIIQVRPTNISEDRELVFKRNVYIATLDMKTCKADILMRGEVLFNNTNSQEQVGKTAWFDLDGNYFSSNHITRIGTKSGELAPQYLTYILNLYQRKKVFFKLCTNWNNQSGVGSDILWRIPIPLPKFTRQTEIVMRLETVRAKARALRDQARADLEKAKRDIENLILGKEAG